MSVSGLVPRPAFHQLGAGFIFENKEIGMARGRMIDKVVILSQKVNAVSEGAENLYYRANISADDYGRYHARPEILKGQTYTLRKRIGLKEIARRVDELWQIGLIRVYEVNGERYLEVVDFGKHQTFKTDRPKKAEYPEPKGYLKYEDGRRVEPVGIQPAPNGSLSKDKLREDKLREVNSSSCPGSKTDPDEVLVQLLVSLMERNNPKSSILMRLTQKRQEEWIRQCRLLREADGKSASEIETIIRFSQKDGFWKTNILSMPKLREQWDQLYMKAKRASGADRYDGIKAWLEAEEKKDGG
jgi:hypothetical protein